MDSNLHREKLLPSEKAYAYKLKLEALKHQGKKINDTSRPNGENLVSADLVGKKLGKSGRQIHRYIRLTELIYQLLDKVDAGKITPTAGSELSFLDTKNQVILNDYLEKEDLGVSILQAKSIRELYVKGKLDENNLESIFVKEEKIEKFYLDFNKLRSYFPEGYTMQQCEDALWEILNHYHR